MDAKTLEECRQRLIAGLKAKYPKHIIGRTAQGEITRRIPTRYHVGKGSHNHPGRGRVVVRNVLAAVYDPANYQLP
jgi:hypothetical protein